jgi:hypothetical protein
LAYNGHITGDEGNNNNSNNNNNKEPKKRRRNIPRRELAKREICRLILEERLTNRQICERLNLPDRTMRRWLAEIFKEDNHRLLEPTPEEQAIEVNLFIEQLAMQRADMLDMAMNTENEVCDRLAAHEMAATAGWSILKTRHEAPAAIIRHVKLPGLRILSPTTE